MDGHGNYLYGVMRAGAELPSRLVGIDDDPVDFLVRGQLAALYSVVPRDDFESAAPTDPAWVVPRALRHEQVVETMHATGPILPVGFGALFSTPEAPWLAGYRLNDEAIGRFLDHVAGKEEWTLKVHVDLDLALESLIAHDPAWAEQSPEAACVAGGALFPGKTTARRCANRRAPEGSCCRRTSAASRPGRRGRAVARSQAARGTRHRADRATWPTLYPANMSVLSGITCTGPRVPSGACASFLRARGRRLIFVRPCCQPRILIAPENESSLIMYAQSQHNAYTQ